MLNYQKIGLWILRLGLATVFLYAGTTLILHPTQWSVYLPFWFKNLLPINPLTYLQIQGIIEIVFALSFITGIGIRITAILASLEMVSILIFYGIDGMTFRDFGILGGTLSLLFFIKNEHGSKKN